MKLYLQALFLSLSLMLAPAAFAQHQTFSVDPSASQVGFTLGGSGHHVQGTFKVQSGSIDFDPTAHTISGSIVVAAGSGNSGEPSRDKKMNSDVLNIDKFSEITFAPNSYTGNLNSSGDSTIEVSGVFTLLGSPHNITVPMQVHIDGTNLAAKGQFTVPYVQWGLKDPSIFILKVAKEVQIDLNLSGHLAH
ncbi:MAG: YceI family protein [Terracidiphilus sp.]